jgi:GT2 family glycosyltransferase
MKGDIMQNRMLFRIAASFLLASISIILFPFGQNEISEAASQTLSILQQGNPLVSIIIPAYNHYEYTDKCLQSIARCNTSVPFELIVVDDCSTDNTWIELSKNKTIHAIHNEKNVGFIETCNRGAAAALGKFLIFLNNDTEVCQGWLEALLHVYSNHHNVGLVGAKLIYPNGKLQEAGSILYKDGTGNRYGWMQDPSDPRFNYVREVDYISGAAIMIRRDLFNKLNGFDTYYAPSYYEDTDLAQKIRRAGLRVLYQPDAQVVHYESVTLGDKKTKQLGTNHKKFVSRWKTALAIHPTHDIPSYLCCDHRCDHRILIIDPYTIHNLNNSEIKLKPLKALIKNNCAVYYFPLGDQFKNEYVHECRQLGIQVINKSFDTVMEGWLALYGSFLNFILTPSDEQSYSWSRLLQQNAVQAKIILFSKSDNLFDLLKGYIL